MQGVITQYQRYIICKAVAEYFQTSALKVYNEESCNTEQKKKIFHKLGRNLKDIEFYVNPIYG